MVALEARADVVVSSLALLLVEVFEAVLALPGDLEAGERATNELISTLAADADSMASASTEPVLAFNDNAMSLTAESEWSCGVGQLERLYCEHWHCHQWLGSP